jgi:hypothetical protein
MTAGTSSSTNECMNSPARWHDGILAGQIAGVLGERIIEGRSVTGTPVRQLPLVAELSVCCGVVGEALQVLRCEGLADNARATGEMRPAGPDPRSSTVSALYATTLPQRRRDRARRRRVRGSLRAGALARTAADLVDSGRGQEVLAAIVRRAVVNAGALACGVAVAGDDGKLAAAGRYGHGGAPADARSSAAPDSGEVMPTMTGGKIRLGKAAAEPGILPDARSLGGGTVQKRSRHEGATT